MSTNSPRHKTDSVLTPHSSRPVISASELGEYIYCSRAWWYRHVVKLAPPDSAGGEGRFTQGRLAHAQHGKRVSQATLLRSVGLALALAGSVIIVTALLLSF